MNKHIFRVATEEGNKLNLSYEQEHTCKVVYKKMENEIGYEFAGLHSPEDEYDDQHIILPLKSVFGGVDSYPMGLEFSNIIGSTQDPKAKDPYGNKYKTWLELINDKTGEGNHCVTDSNCYNPVNGEIVFNRVCNTRMIGGHIVKGRNCLSPSQGSKVYLITICDSHNKRTTTYMKTSQSGKMIVLDRYFQ